PPWRAWSPSRESPPPRPPPNRLRRCGPLADPPPSNRRRRPAAVDPPPALCPVDLGLGATLTIPAAWYDTPNEDLCSRADSVCAHRVAGRRRQEGETAKAGA